MMANGATPRPESTDDSSRSPRQIVLVGAGHAHLQVVEWWRRRPLPAVKLTLLSAFDRAAYSGMLPGTLAGALDPAEFAIDLAALTHRSGVRLVVDRAISIDPRSQTIACAHHPALSYDAVSINIGSVPRGEQLCQTHRTLVSVKPLLTFRERFEIRLNEWQAQQREFSETSPLRLAVVGGGAAGVELALCLEVRLRLAQVETEICLIDSGPELLTSSGAAARRLVHRELERRRITVLTERRIVGCDENGPTALIQDDGARFPCDIAVWVTGAAPHAVSSRFGLPVTEPGFLSIRSTLQSTGYDNVFVVGDAADLAGTPISKAGVYAVRQGPVLFENLRRHVAGKRLKTYEPQSSFLSLLACGDGTAILDYHGWAAHARWVWWLKTRIDRSFVRRFRTTT